MRRIETWEDLEKLKGVSTEGADLDFKEALDPDAPAFAVELGKDVAALANTLGGHILVGVSTENGRTRCVGFHGCPVPLATRIRAHCEDIIKERCRPQPFAHVHCIDLPSRGGQVVVLRVGASAVAPVGARVKMDAGERSRLSGESEKAGQKSPLLEKLWDHGWVFPYRVASQTDFLSPDQFGAFELMSTRRIAALLFAIPVEARTKVVVTWYNGANEVRQAVALLGVAALENVATFKLGGGQPAPPRRHRVGLAGGRGRLDRGARWPPANASASVSAKRRGQMRLRPQQVGLRLSSGAVTSKTTRRSLVEGACLRRFDGLAFLRLTAPATRR